MSRLNPKRQNGPARAYSHIPPRPRFLPCQRCGVPVAVPHGVGSAVAATCALCVVKAKAAS